LEEGVGVLVAPAGSKVGSQLITTLDFDGVLSEGMFLSAKELGLQEQKSGPFYLEEPVEPGTPAEELLGSGDYLLEVEVTPNRGDLLSVKGLAREISALLGVPKRERPPMRYEEFGDLQVRLESPDCKRYRAGVVEGVKVKPSPLWLRRRLWQCGLKTINNVVDITNYVMLSEGQPLHAFDLKKLKLPLIVRDAKEGETLKTLLGVEKTLKPVNLLIADVEKPLALAGVVGGLESSVEEETTDVLLESAYFDPYRVRRSAKEVGMQTESSYRFERSVDIEGVRTAQDYAISLLLELAGGRLTALKDVYPEPYKPRRVFLSADKYRRYAGQELDRVFASETLQRLEISHTLKEEGVEAYVPSHRSFDLQGEADLVEELLRVQGYEKVKSSPLKVVARPSEVETLQDRVRDLMVSRGFSEVVTFSFESSELYEKLSLPLPTLEVVNPLSKSQRFLRNTLIPSLLRVCLENARNYNHHMAIFEVAKVYEEEEELRLGFLMTGYRSLFPQAEHTPYEALSLVQDLLELYGADCQSQASDYRLFHPNLQRSFALNGELVAVVGVLNPELQEELELWHRVLLGEVRLSKLRAQRKAYKPLSYFPPAVRDITLLVDKDVGVDKLISYVKKLELVEEVKVFSIYTDPKLGEGKKSVSLRLTLRSKEETLSDQQVSKLVEGLLKELEDHFGAKLR
ncbi:MAG: phenylalanine--tRNA ligase subunit beta, partial [Aquificaceae bacterium]|nr:phenylalanine--tRNA ligase subunit beta [Aquificaceae bacterium]